MLGTETMRNLWRGRHRTGRAKAPRKGHRPGLRVEDLEGRTMLSTFYVSPTGSDTNSGTSSSSPWQTIGKVDSRLATGLNPGDRVLFQGGGTFSGNLSLSGNDGGAAGNPVTIGTYGTGTATVDAGTGTGILLDGASYVAISNLVLVGSSSPVTSEGIYLEGSSSNVGIDGVDVGGFGGIGIDINVNTADQHSNIGYGQPGGTYSNVSITDSAAHDNAVGGVEADNMTDLYVGHVQMYHNAGNGVFHSGFGFYANNCSHVVVEYSVAHDNGYLAGNSGAMGGIGAIGGDHALFQYDESYGNVCPGPTGDGEGFVLDDITDSAMQFNYSHGNTGSGFWAGAETGHTSDGIVVRFNVSQDDANGPHNAAQGGVLLVNQVSDAEVYGNTVYATTGSNAAISLLNVDPVSGADNVEDNIFFTAGGVPIVANGTAAPGAFAGNDYYGSGAASPPSWAQGTTVNPSLTSPGGGGTIYPNALSGLGAYKLASGSPMVGAGLSLSQMGQSWDPYDYAGDSFLSPHFNTTPSDFYGNALPATGGNIGADQSQPLAVGGLGDAGFESPSEGTGFNAYAYAPAGTAWTYGGYSGSPGNGAGVAANGSAFTYYNPAAPQGTQVAFLQATGSFTQSVSGLAAGTYTVSFDAAQRANSSGVQDQNFEVLVDGGQSDGVVAGTFTPASGSYAGMTTASFALAAGTHTITFQGLDSAGGDNTALVDNVQLNLSSLTATTTTLSSSADPSTSGGPVTFTAAVAPRSGGGTPTGTVTFTVDGTAQAPATLSVVGGVDLATFSTSSLAAGTHAIGASYGGDSAFSASGAAALTQTVNPATGGTLADAGFESPSEGTGVGAYAYDPTGTAWTYAGNAGVSGNGSTFTYYNPAAPEGAQVGFLQQTGSFSQSVAGLAAGTYQLTFQAAQRANSSGWQGQNFEVLVDGTVVGSFTPASSSYSGLTTANFTLTAGTHTFEFEGLDSAGGDNTAFIDAIQLNQESTTGLADAGFESPSEASGFQYAPTGTPWTFSGGGAPTGAGISGNGSGFTSGNPNAPGGTQVAFLQEKGWFSQAVGLAAGTYTIGFDAAQRENYGGAQSFEVLVDGNVVGTFSGLSTSYAGLTTSAFAVAAGSHTVEFLGLDPGGTDDTAFVDNISVAMQTTTSLADAGFESPALGSGSSAYQYDPAGTPWAFSQTNSGIAANGSTFTGGNPVAPEGTQVGFLERKGYFSQAVNLAAGTYTIGLDAAQRANFGGAQSFEVLVDGGVVGTFSNLSTSYTALTTNSFTVAAGSHTIEFLGLDPDGGDDTAFIDDVSLTPG